MNREQDINPHIDHPENFQTGERILTKKHYTDPEFAEFLKRVKESSEQQPLRIPYGRNI